MKIAVLDNITGFGKHDWSAYWVPIWFICGLLALFFGFWTTTEQTALDWFYLLVSVIGLLCVVSLAFAKTSQAMDLGCLPPQVKWWCRRHQGRWD